MTVVDFDNAFLSALGKAENFYANNDFYGAYITLAPYHDLRFDMNHNKALDKMTSGGEDFGL